MAEEEKENKATRECSRCGGKMIDHGGDCYSCEKCHREFGPVDID